jgi:hypothetical protein
MHRSGVLCWRCVCMYVCMYVGYLSIFRVPVLLWKMGSCVLVLVSGDSLTSRTGCQLMACGCGCHYVDPCPALILPWRHEVV